MIPLPFDQIRDRLLAAQRELNPRLQEPIISRRALFVLSRHVATVCFMEDAEAFVMEFFGLYWVHEDPDVIGFFETEEQATRYLMGKMDLEL